MSSISAVGSQFTSPLQLLKNELSSEVTSGVVATSDQEALSAALDAIDEAMRSQAQSGRASGTRPSPSDMQAKLESLISAQVDSGTLTSSQADELKNIFAAAMPQPPEGGPGDPGGAMAKDDDSDTDSTQST